MLAKGYISPTTMLPDSAVLITGEPLSPAIVAILFAFPVAMALATGIEAPLTSIAQLGQLDDDGKRRFGRGTLVLTVGIVGAITLLLAGLAVRLNVGIPGEKSTQIADIAKAAAGDGGVFALFQLTSAILLLSAASSSYQAGPGPPEGAGRDSGGRARHPAGAAGPREPHHTPYWSVVVYLGISFGVLVAAGAEEQELVLFYAVAVFASFMMGLLAMASFSWQEQNWKLFTVNCIASVAVFFTLVINLGRGYPLASFGALLAHRRRPLPGVGQGRPAGGRHRDREGSRTSSGLRATWRGAWRTTSPSSPPITSTSA